MTDNISIPTQDAITDFGDEVIRRKLIDAEVPGAVVEFDPEEAERAGAFVEDALSEEDAREAEDGMDELATRSSGGLLAAARTNR